MTELKLPESLVSSLAADLPSTDYAYQMGYDYSRHGASEVNCFFTLFATPELLRAWEEGKADAAAGK